MADASTDQGVIDFPALVALCHEIDPSWDLQAVELLKPSLYLTDAGFVRLRPEHDWVQIDMIGVIPAERGKGRGRELVEIAEDVAHQLSLIGVGVATVNPEFFAHLGFDVVGRLPGVANGKDLTVMFKEIEKCLPL